MISQNGGVDPAWSRDGKEIFFLTAEGSGKLMAAKVSAAHGEFHADAHQALFDCGICVGFDVAADARRFLFAVLLEGSGGPFTVLLNWQEGLKK